MNSVGLFVDYEKICVSLANKESGAPNHEKIACKLIDLAEARGEILCRIAWADWDRFPGAQRVLASQGYDTRFVPSSPEGEGSASAMLGEIRRTFESDRIPDSLVVVSCDRRVLPLAEENSSAGRKTVLIAVPGTSPNELIDIVEEYIPIEQMTTTDLESSSDREVPAIRATTNFVEGADPSKMEVIKSIRRSLERLLYDRRLPWISYRLFANHLVSQNITPAEQVHDWIERSVQEGYVIREEERGAVKRFCKFTPARLDGHGTASADYLERASLPHAPPPHRGDARFSRGNGTEEKRFGESFEHEPRSTGWSRDWRNFTFVKIIWALQNLLSDKPQRFYINPSTLVEVLREEGVGYSEEEVFFWVNQSVDKGILIRDVKEAGAPSGQKLYRYYLNHQSRLVVLSRDVPRAFCQTVHGVLERRTEWNGIAFNFLLRLLQVHPLLANPSYDLPSGRLREWINFLIDERIFIKFSEPDLREPTRLTTMVSLDHNHPHTQRFLDEAETADFFSPEHQALLRTILTIDHFLHWLRTKSPDEDWLPLMTLKSWQRAMLGDQLTKWAIAECEREAIFTIDRYQNKGGVEATVAGVRLEYKHPLVVSVLERRDEFLRLLIGLLRNRATVPHAVLEQRLAEDERFGVSASERLGWLPLMLDTKVLTLEKDSRSGGDFQRALLCRLNAREKFVGELLSRVIRLGQARPESRAGSSAGFTGSLFQVVDPTSSPSASGRPPEASSGVSEETEVPSRDKSDSLSGDRSGDSEAQE